MLEKLAHAGSMTDQTASDFTPVPTQRVRFGGWTPERQRAFLDYLAECGAVSLAARAVGLTPKSAYLLRARPGAESFAAAWDRALGAGRARMFDLAMERTLHGYTVPLKRRGKIVGERRRFNDRLLFAACYGLAAKG